MQEMRARLSGHALAEGGAAHRFDADKGIYFRDFTNRYFGVALCQCGAHSQVLSATVARQAWHRQHKAQVA